MLPIVHRLWRWLVLQEGIEIYFIWNYSAKTSIRKKVGRGHDRDKAFKSGQAFIAGVVRCCMAMSFPLIESIRTAESLQNKLLYLNSKSKLITSKPKNNFAKAIPVYIMVSFLGRIASILASPLIEREAFLTVRRNHATL